MAILSFVSSECILKFMDPVFRFKLRAWCPPLNPLEKHVPIKVDYLYFAPCVFQINQTIFKLGVKEFYRPGFEPEYQKDPEGIPEDTRMFHEKEPVRTAEQLEALEIEEEKKRLECEKALAVLEEVPSNEEVLKHIKVLKNHLSSIYIRKNSVHRMQLTVTCGDYRQVEILGYSKSIHEAVRYLKKRIFGDRGKVQVKVMEVKNWGPGIPFPEDMKLGVQHLEVRCPQVLLMYMSPILVEPLETLEVDKPGLFGHHIAQNAGLLIYRMPMDVENPWNLGHPRVYVRHHQGTFGWVRDRALGFRIPENGVPLGHRFSLTAGSKNGAKKILNEIGNVEGAKQGKLSRNGHRCISFHMVNKLKLVIYTERAPKSLSKWMITMEAVDKNDVILGAHRREID